MGADKPRKTVEGLRWVGRRAAVLAPIAGAALGGAAGGLLGAELGAIGGGAAGGAAGYLVQRATDRIAGSDQERASIPGSQGDLLVDITDFVGRTEELAKLRSRAGESKSSVSLLYGFGGCGKTALLKKFATDEGLFASPRRARDRRPTFVWSFTQDPSLERFFHEFTTYIKPILSSADRVAYEASAPSFLGVPDALQRSGKTIYLLLDGLEVVALEDDVEAERDGSLCIPALRVLLQRAAEGRAGNLKMFCTSRVVPPELNRRTSSSFQALDLTELLSSDGVELLRRKGVKGGDDQLERTVGDLRNHAFSIALMGDLLRTTFRGDIRQAGQVLGVSAELETPLLRVLAWYEQRLEANQLATVQAVALFRTSVTTDEVAVLLPILSITDGAPASGENLAIARMTVSALSKLGLVVENGDGAVGLHPIIREYFYSQLTDPESFHLHALRIAEARLPEQVNISDGRELSMLTEIVFQALRANQLEVAWKVYKDRIGGYPALGYELADHPSGTTIVDMFLRQIDGLIEALPSDAIFDLYTDAALYLKNEGRLDDAIETLQRLELVGQRIDSVDDRPVSSLLVRAGIELLRGEVASSSSTLDDAKRRFGEISYDLPDSTERRVKQEFLTRAAAVLGVRGGPALTMFEQAAAITLDSGTVPHDFGPIRHVWTLTHHGMFEEAQELADASLSYPEAIGAAMLSQRVSAMAAINSAWAGDLKQSAQWSAEITPWSLKADIHVAVLDFVRQGVTLFKEDLLDEAHDMLGHGIQFAGDNGFLLEWLDMTALDAFVMLRLAQPDGARDLAEDVIRGAPDGYLVPLKGASDQAVGYVWPLASARAIKALCEGDEMESILRSLSMEPGLQSVVESANPLLAAIVEFGDQTGGPV